MRKNDKGFSLIEIMIVVVIMSILATIVAPRVLGRADEARIIATKQDIATIVQALKFYKLDNQNYPTQDQGLNALIQKPEQEPYPSNWNEEGYLEKLPKDPWGNTYQYQYPGIHKSIDIYSLGPKGTEAQESDYIGSWQL